MNKKIGFVLLAVGILLILCALSIILYNSCTADSAKENSVAALDELKAIIDSNASSPDDSPSVTSDSEADSEADSKASPFDSEIIGYLGHSYIGYLSIPVLSLELPVLSQWNGDYSMLDIAPCRHFGSPNTNDLVIAGHNYVSHFANLSYLERGHTLSFTCADGSVIDYTVSDFRIVEADDTDSIQNSGFDLVLYTCNYSGDARYAVFCSKIIDN